VNGQRHVRAQQAAVARIHARETGAIARQKADIQRYRQPSTIALPYWQDPTDVSGYMRYGLTAFAVKPPSALGALAIGQSNIVPFYLRARLDYISPPEAAYDFENPRALAVGSFDLAFVLVYVMPLALIVLTASRLSAERDSGALRLIAAQPASARVVVSATFAAATLVAVPIVLVTVWLALAVAGVHLLEARLLAPMMLVMSAVAAYALFWISVAALVAPRRGAVATTALLVTLWIASAFLVPALGALALNVLQPAPSRLLYLDALRWESDWTDKQRNSLVAAYLAARPAYASGVARLAEIPYATKQIAVQTELERRLHDRTVQFDQARSGAARSSRWLRLASPSLVLGAILEAAAGSDSWRQEAFLVRARQYTDQLRAFFWPRALKEAAQPTIRACSGCPAKMAFLSHDDIPKFAEDDPVAGVARRIAPQVGYLWLVAAIAAFAAWRPGTFAV
jgi:ABC-2 type transport system permease protein